MVFVPEVSTINQRLQIGAEATIGTAVPANKLLECFDFTVGINGDVLPYGATGHKYDLVQEENTEWVDLTVSGQMDYNGILYLLGGAMGAVTPAAYNGSAVAKSWTYTPPTSGSIAPQTYSMEQGDSTRARKWAYTLFNSFGYTATRKDVKLSAKAITLPLADGITLTASPTPIALAPIVGKQINVYLDSTSAGLGVTQLIKFLSVDFLFDGIYGPFWPLNRANIGYTSHVDLKPKTTVKLKMEADSVGMSLLGMLQVGSTQFLRVNALGAVIDNNQTVSLGAPSAGTFTLTYKGQTSSALAFNATGATVQTALLLLSSFPAGTVTVSGGAGGPYVISLLTTLALDLTAITGNGASLTGGTFLITQTQIYQTFQHDMAIKIGKPSTFSDDAGIFAIEWTCGVFEDPAWAKAHTLLVANLITAL